MTGETQHQRTQAIGSRVRARREALGLSQADAAAEMGIPQSTLSRLEAARNKARRATIERAEAWLAGRPVELPCAA